MQWKSRKGNDKILLKKKDDLQKKWDKIKDSESPYIGPCNSDDKLDVDDRSGWGGEDDATDKTDSNKDNAWYNCVLFYWLIFLVFMYDHPRSAHLDWDQERTVSSPARLSERPANALCHCRRAGPGSHNGSLLSWSGLKTNPAPPGREGGGGGGP